MALCIRGKRVQIRVIVPLVLVLLAVMLTASGCGAGNEPTRTELLRSANPLTSDVYIQIRGPAGAVNYLGNTLQGAAFTNQTGAFTEADSGFFVPPALHNRLHEHRICLFVETIQPWDRPEIQPWVGKKITVTVYGNKSSVLFCRLFGTVVLGAH